MRGAEQVLGLIAQKHGLATRFNPLNVATGEMELSRVVDGRRHRLLIGNELVECARDLVDLGERLNDKVGLFVWSTERPRVMTAGYCGTPRFLGRRCAI